MADCSVTVAIETVTICVQVDIIIDERVHAPTVLIEVPRSEPILKSVIHSIAIRVRIGWIGHSQKNRNDCVWRFTLLPSIEVSQQSLSTGLLGDENVEHTLSFLSRLLCIPIDVEQWGIAWMINPVFRVRCGKRKFLRIDQTVFIAIEIAVAGNKWIQCPCFCREIPCGEQVFDAVEHAVTIGIDVVRVRSPTADVDLILRQEGTKRSSC